MPATLMSAAQFELLPDYPGKQELLQGELITSPPAKLPHSRIAKALLKLLMAAVDESRVYLEAGYQMTPDTWLVPDISVTWPDQTVENDYLHGSPMIAIEIVSRGNTADEIDRKTAAYLNHGAAEVWIVYPRTGCMMVHRGTGVERISDTYASGSIPVTVRLAEILAAG
jgi:Uma2 family endonuclease